MKVVDIDRELESCDDSEIPIGVIFNKTYAVTNGKESQGLNESMEIMVCRTGVERGLPRMQGIIRGTIGMRFLLPMGIAWDLDYAIEELDAILQYMRKVKQTQKL